MFQRKGSYDAKKDVLIHTVAELPGSNNTKLIVEVREYNESGAKVSCKRIGTRKDGSLWFGDLGRITALEAGPLGNALVKAADIASRHAASKPPTETAAKSGPVVDLRGEIAQAVAAAVVQALNADKLVQAQRRQRKAERKQERSNATSPATLGATAEQVGALIAQ